MGIILCKLWNVHEVCICIDPSFSILSLNILYPLPQYTCRPITYKSQPCTFLLDIYIHSRNAWWVIKCYQAGFNEAGKGPWTWSAGSTLLWLESALDLVQKLNIMFNLQINVCNRHTCTMLTVLCTFCDRKIILTNVQTCYCVYMLTLIHTIMTIERKSFVTCMNF